MMRERPGKGIRGAESGPPTNVLRKLVKLSAVRTNEGRLFQTVVRSMRTDEHQCSSMKTVLKVGLT